MATRRPKNELSAIEQALSAEKRLKSHKARTNAALLELGDHNSDRVKALVANARLDKIQAHEEQRAKIVGELSEGAVAILRMSGDEFLVPMTEIQMRMMAGLPATDGVVTVSPGVAGQDPEGESAALENGPSDADSMPVRRGRPRT